MSSRVHRFVRSCEQLFVRGGLSARGWFELLLRLWWRDGGLSVEPLLVVKRAERDSGDADQGWKNPGKDALCSGQGIVPDPLCPKHGECRVKRDPTAEHRAHVTIEPPHVLRLWIPHQLKHA